MEMVRQCLLLFIQLITAMITHLILPEISVLSGVEAVEGMEHESGCYSHKHCGVAGCNHPPWAGFHHMQKPTYMHEFEPGRCSCRIDELRRGLEVMIK
jgi:hypothetical protein